MTTIPPITETNPPFTSPPTWPFPTTAADWEPDYRLRLLENAALLQFNPAYNGWANVKMFGAKGDGVTDDTAAIQTAFNNSTQIYVPPGQYILSAPIVPQNPGGPYAGTLQGTGWNSNFKWTNLGTKATCETINEDVALKFPTGWIIKDIRLTGPVAGQQAGINNSCYLSGIVTPRGGVVDDVWINGFHAGAIIASDHIIFRRMRCEYNFYGATWPDYAFTLGNLSMYDCHFDNNCLAGWHMGCGASSSFTWSNAYQINFSWNPWGILMTDGLSGWDGNNNPIYAGTASVANGLYEALLDNVDAESIGNGFFCDMSSNTLSVYGGDWNRTGAFTFVPANIWAKAPIPTAYQNASWTIVGNFSGLTWDIDLLNGTWTHTNKAAQGYTNINYINVLNNLWSGQVPPGNALKLLYMFTANFDGATHINNLYPSYAPGIAATFQSADGSRLAWQMRCTAAITKGQLVQLSGGTQGWVQPATGTSQVIGVALTTTTAANQDLIVARKGTMGDAAIGAGGWLTANVAIAAGQLCIPSSVTPTQLMPATATSNNIVGLSHVAVSAGASMGLFELRCAT